LDRAITAPIHPHNEKKPAPLLREKTVGAIVEPADEEAPEPPLPSKVFKVLGKLGEGAFGSVVKALDSRDGKLVAIKIVNTEDEDLSSLESEIAFLKDCKSPYVVGFKGSFVEEKKLWIAMEFCDAGSLLDLMKATLRPLAEPEIAAVMVQVAQGMVTLHNQKTVHRDIKAANILLTSRGECKLADFGISCVLTDQWRHSLKGTPYWMAPEVVNAMAGVGYDWHADIWSLGITAYELAIGKPPLSDIHPMRAIFKIANAPAPTLPVIEGKVWSKEFQQFISACLDKEFLRRPSASGLLELPFLKGMLPRSAPMLAALAEAAIPAIDAKRDEIEDDPKDGATLVKGAAAPPPAGELSADMARAELGEDEDFGSRGSVAVTIVVKPHRQPSYMRLFDKSQ